MKTNIHMAALVSALLAASTATQAYAENTYMLQLGSYPTREDAESKWDSLKASQSSALKGLDMNVTESGSVISGVSVFRTQAGPVDSKEKAQSICSALLSKGESCFVVESSGNFAPQNNTPSAYDNESEVAETAPSIWDEKATAASAAPAAGAQSKPSPAPEMEVGEPSVQREEKESAFLPWLSGIFSSDDEPAKEPVAEQEPAPLTTMAAPMDDRALATPAPAPAPTFKAQYAPAADTSKPLFVKNAPQTLSFKGKESDGGQVAVSEAIRVPLTQESPAAVPGRARYQGNFGKTYPSQQVPGQRSLWAKLSYFLSESAATDFWEEFKYNNPDLTYGARARVTKPLNARSNSERVSLRVGPYAYTDNIRDICTLVSGMKLTCNVVSDLGSSALGNRVRTRRPSFAPSARDYDMRAPIVQSGAAYWLHLGSFGSPREADSAWKSIKRSNNKLLGRMGSTVTTPPRGSSSNSMYRLRTGPFATSSDAQGMCGKLKLAGTNCIVISGR